MGLITRVRQALYCIQEHSQSLDLEKIWTGRQFKQLEKLLEEPRFLTLQKLLKGEAIISAFMRKYYLMSVSNWLSLLMYSDIRLLNEFNIHSVK